MTVTGYKKTQADVMMVGDGWCLLLDRLAIFPAKLGGGCFKYFWYFHPESLGFHDPI